MSASTPPESPYNPLSHDSIEKINERRKKELEAKAAIEEDIIQYKAVLARLASSEDGKYFLRKLIRFSGAFSFDAELNPAKLVEERGRRAAYLQLVRPYLNVTLRAELEIET